MAELAQVKALDIGDYIAAVKRRRGLILTIGSLIFLTGLIISYVLPPTYQSSATILIEEQEIPLDLVRTTITSFASQRIQVINQRVMTRSNLLRIIDEYQLYVDELKKKTTEEVIQKMRKNIKIDMITAQVLNPRTGSPGIATIAFTIGFEHGNPRKAQKVASEMTTLYLNENLKTRTEKVAETYEFLSAEADRLKTEIARLETILAAFKERNLYRLPESRGINTSSLSRLETEIASNTLQVQGLQERRTYLQGQLALLDPYGLSSGSTEGIDPTSPAARLNALRTQLITLSSRYSPNHPDISTTKREILALENQTGNYNATENLREKIDALRQELTVAGQIYTRDHPDVKNLQRQIDTLEDKLRNQPAGVESDSAPANPDNPAYITIKSALTSTDSSLRILGSQRTALLDKISEYEERLLQTPKVEQEYRTITRDLSQTSIRYQEIRAKQMTAEVAKELEKERKGEKFTLIEPAILPQEPISPNRPAIVMVSLLLALGAGFGSGFAAESMSSVVRGAKGVIAILETAPLAVIPYLSNSAEISAQIKKRKIIIVSIIAGILIFFLLVHLLYSPLDVLWFRGLRKVNSVM